jgi:hypothetical protein
MCVVYHGGHQRDIFRVAASRGALVVKVCRAFVVLLLLGSVATACSSTSTPLSPAPTTGSSPNLTAPTPESPADSTAVTTYRPTLVVRNGSSTQSGAKVYEFQISDRSDFSAASTAVTAFTVVAHTTGVPEGSAGTTSYTTDVDLQPTTRLYWRARMLQGTDLSAWTATRSFTTPIAGYSRAGELYDPLVYGSTVGTPVGSTTFVSGKGIRLNDSNSYVRYQLQQPLSSGEFSMVIEGLAPNGPGPKLKVFSMSDGTGDVYRSNYLLVAQYRGSNGNPDNCIAFKALLGDPALKLEPDFGERDAAVMRLDPSRGYIWKGTWSNGFRLVVQEESGGRTLYDLAKTADAVYNPTPHFAYLGANNGPFGEEDGSFPGAIYRNVCIGRGPGPASLGSALLPQ